MSTAHPTGQEYNPTFLGFKLAQGTLHADYLIVNSDRAREIMTGLVPYMKYAYEIEVDPEMAVGESEPTSLEAEVESLFPAHITNAASGLIWSDQHGCVVSLYDTYIEEITGDMTDLFDLTGFLGIIPTISDGYDNPTPGQANILATFTGAREDSVQTGFIDRSILYSENNSNVGTSDSEDTEDPTPDNMDVDGGENLGNDLDEEDDEEEAEELPPILQAERIAEANAVLDRFTSIQAEYRRDQEEMEKEMRSALEVDLQKQLAAYEQQIRATLLQQNELFHQQMMTDIVALLRAPVTGTTATTTTTPTTLTMTTPTTLTNSQDLLEMKPQGSNDGTNASPDAPGVADAGDNP